MLLTVQIWQGEVRREQVAQTLGALLSANAKGAKETDIIMTCLLNGGFALVVKPISGVSRVS
jgi:hypothetical protein